MQPDKSIYSFQNSHVQTIRNLRNKKYRDETGLMIIEGRREVWAAQHSGIAFQDIYFSETWANDEGSVDAQRSFKANAVSHWVLKDALFEKISFGHRQEGVLAVCAQPHKTIKDFKLSKCPLLVIVEHVEKPGNLGAILRTCDGVGVDGLIICDPITDIYNPNVVRSSLGTIFSVPLAQATNADALAFLQEHRIQICATVIHSSLEYTDAKMSMPLAFVLGSEQNGLSDFWQGQAHFKIKIPMKGKADSLNVSATAAIVLYEALRQRK